MSRAPRSRKTCKISDSLNRRLNTYAQVAAAAGVSVLALVGASEAQVVYTPTNEVTRAGFPLYIDLNHDGIKDFLLRTTFYVGTAGTDLGLSAAGYHNDNNRVVGRHLRTSGGYFFSVASALPAGARIGPNRHFSATLPFMAEELFKRVGDEYSDQGAWEDKGKGVKDRYLGLKFVIDGETHYGWARLSVTLAHERQYDDVSGTLTGYAYETTPDKPIIAGQITGPDVITVQAGTLGGLALGRK
jgi:hypothetical protein